MIFLLGAHHPRWLERAGVPLFVSHRALARRPLPRARVPWSLDSGAFTEVASFGRFVTSPAEYVAAVRRYRDEVGLLQWAAPQDHMCEPFVLARSTLAGTVDEAQAWTVDNYLELRTLGADLPLVPVVQGQTLDDYRRHVDAYLAAGIDLTACELVGLGSVCRREATGEIGAIVTALAGDGLHLHGFGVKSSGLRRYGAYLTSADSMAWSRRGRNIRPCPHTGAASCSNCLPHALAWRARVVAAAASSRRHPVQGNLW